MFSFGLLKSIASRITGWIRSGVRRGLTVDEIGDAVVPIVGKLPASDLAVFVQHEADSQDTWTLTATVPMDHVISKEFASVNTEFQRAPYRYNAHVMVENKQTGEAYKTWYTVESNTLLTRQQIHDDLADIEGLPTGSGEERLIEVLDYEFLLRREDE